jgi:nitrogen fixation protein NifU and related proteins
MQTDALYQQLILDHAKTPHGRGLSDTFNGDAHHVNPTCGDEIDVRVLVKDGVVVDVSHDGMGCSISQAAASVMYDLTYGRPVDEALERESAFGALITSRGTIEPDEDLLEDGIAFAGVARYPARVKCALLPWTAFKDALVRGIAATSSQSSEDSHE